MFIKGGRLGEFIKTLPNYIQVDFYVHPECGLDIIDPVSKQLNDLHRFRSKPSTSKGSVNSTDD